MNAHWQRTENPGAAAGPLFMNALLTPHRSLSRKAFTIVLVGFAAVDLAIAAIFLLHGAYPAAAFLLLDIVLLWLAFRINYRDGRAAERVEVAADRVLVSRFSAAGAAAHWMVSPAFAQAQADSRAVRIASAGKSVRVGAFLSPPERGAFAAALGAALQRARREGYRSSTSRIE